MAGRRVADDVTDDVVVIGATEPEPGDVQRVDAEVRAFEAQVASQELVTLMVPLDDSDRATQRQGGGGPIYLKGTYNGVAFEVVKGKSVKVPRGIADILQNTMNADRLDGMAGGQPVRTVTFG